LATILEADLWRLGAWRHALVTARLALLAGTMTVAGCASSTSHFEEAHPWWNKPFVEAQIDEVPEPVQKQIDRSQSKVKQVEYCRTDDGARVFRLILDSGSYEHYGEDGRRILGGII